MELYISLKEVGKLVGFPFLVSQYEDETDDLLSVIIFLGDYADTTIAQELFLDKHANVACYEIK